MSPYKARHKAESIKPQDFSSVPHQRATPSRDRPPRYESPTVLEGELMDDGSEDITQELPIIDVEDINMMDEPSTPTVSASEFVHDTPLGDKNHEYNIHLDDDDIFAYVEDARADTLNQDSDEHIKEALRENPRYVREDSIDQLNADITRAGIVYTSALSKSKLFGTNKSVQRRMADVDNKHQAYAMMMAYSCIQPLRQGVSFGSVARTAGMAASMWMLDKNFRNSIKDAVDIIDGSVRQGISHQISKAKISEKTAVDNAVSLSEKEGKPLSMMWRLRQRIIENPLGFDRQALADRIRTPFTAESAAMTKVALDRDAYEALREKGADRETIIQEHVVTVSQLYRDAEHDGISSEDLSAATRAVVARSLHSDPSIGAMYTELSNSSLVPGQPQRIRVKGDPRIHTLASTDFYSQGGQRVSAGVFELREPMDKEEHIASMASGLYNVMAHSGSTMELASVMRGYAVAFAKNDSMNVLNEASGVRSPIRQVDAMRSAMSADGLDEYTQQESLNAAFSAALDGLEAESPARAQALENALGDNWKFDLVDTVTNVDATRAQFEATKQASERKSQTYRPSHENSAENNAEFSL